MANAEQSEAQETRAAEAKQAENTESSAESLRRPPYGFYVTIVAILGLLTAFLLLLLIVGPEALSSNPKLVGLGFLSILVVIGILVGAYFGIAASRDAAREINTVTSAAGRYATQLAEHETGATPTIGDILKVGGTQTELLNRYYRSVLAQANQSFRWALVFVGLGLLFFFAAMMLLVLTRLQDVATISVIAGALVEVISGINFYLYNKSSAQLAVFQQALDQTQRFLLANTICELLESEARDKARSELVHTIAERPPKQ